MATMGQIHIGIPPPVLADWPKVTIVDAVVELKPGLPIVTVTVTCPEVSEVRRAIPMPLIPVIRDWFDRTPPVALQVSVALGKGVNPLKTDTINLACCPTSRLVGLENKAAAEGKAVVEISAVEDVKPEAEAVIVALPV